MNISRFCGRKRPSHTVELCAFSVAHAKPFSGCWVRTSNMCIFDSRVVAINLFIIMSLRSNSNEQTLKTESALVKIVQKMSKTSAHSIFHISFPFQCHVSQIEHFYVAVIIARADDTFVRVVRVSEYSRPSVTLRFIFSRLYECNRRIFLPRVPYFDGAYFVFLRKSTKNTNKNLNI